MEIGKKRQSEEDAEEFKIRLSSNLKKPSQGTRIQPIQLSKADNIVDRDYFRSYSYCEVHALMLSDRRRTLTYQLALTRAHALLKDAIVLDVGCGTGILSIFAAKAGAKAVIGLDAVSNLINLSRRLIAENNLSHAIKVINCRVEDSHFGVDRVDSIVSEWMGYCLLYENMLTSVLYARDMYLYPHAHSKSHPLDQSELASWRRKRLFPCTANLYIAAFTESVSSLEDDDFSANECMDVDSSTRFAKQELWTELSELYKVKLDASFYTSVSNEIIHQIHVGLLDPKAIVSDVWKLVALDLASIETSDLVTNGVKGNFQLTMLGTASVSGFAIWFSVEFPDGDILSTSPYDPATHWQQCLIHLPNPVDVQQDDSITGSINFSHPVSNKRDLNLALQCCFDGSPGHNVKNEFNMEYYLQT